MLFRFCGIGLDDSSRRLLVEGREVAVQRLVFDLLAHLLRHRDRVVSKDELVEVVWAGAFVADGAVQRAVSVARKVLRDGGVPDAIRTYPRQGYRFSCPLEADREESAAPAPEAGSASARAHAALARGAWSDAVRAFEAADAGESLRAEELEAWGRAAENFGESDRAVTPLERAVAAFASEGDPRGAARAALRIANIQLERRETAVGKGWLRRAEHSLRGDEASREAGLLAWLSGRFALFDGDLERALERAERCFALGRQLEDTDLEALGLVYRGFTLVALGDTEAGPALLDEAGAVVLGGGTDPWVAGLVFCGIIWACINWGDLRRAAAWTDQFTRWCEVHAIAGYPGICRLHRAEVMTLRGELRQAEQEVQEASRMLSRSSPWAEGDAFRVLGEVRLHQGDLEGAEAAFRRAHQLGWDAQPGLALLQVAQGRGEAAVRGLERALADPGWQQQRRTSLLAHLARVAVAAGLLDRAREAVRELEERPGVRERPLVAAMVAHAQGEVALAEGRTAEGTGHLQESVRRWLEVRSPFNAAGVRLRLARSLAADGDLEGADLELSAAEATFETMGLAALVASCRESRALMGGSGGRGSASRDPTVH